MMASGESKLRNRKPSLTFLKNKNLLCELIAKNMNMKVFQSVCMGLFRCHDIFFYIINKLELVLHFCVRDTSILAVKALHPSYHECSDCMSKGNLFFQSYYIFSCKQMQL